MWRNDGNREEDIRKKMFSGQLIKTITVPVLCTYMYMNDEMKSQLEIELTAIGAIIAINKFRMSIYCIIIFAVYFRSALNG